MRYLGKSGAAGLGAAPIVSGPYRFVEWKKGESVSLAADRAYWRGAPYFDTVKFRSVPEQATRVAGLPLPEDRLVKLAAALNEPWSPPPSDDAP